MSKSRVFKEEAHFNNLKSIKENTVLKYELDFGTYLLEFEEKDFRTKAKEFAYVAKKLNEIDSKEKSRSIRKINSNTVAK